MDRTERNGVLIPWFLLSAAAAVALCFLLSLRGWAFAGMLVVFFVAAFAALWLLLALFVLVASRFIDPNKPVEHRSAFCAAIVNYVMALLVATARIRVHVEGAELVPAEQRFLVVCNHRSNFDPLVLGWVLRRFEVAFISKPENFKIPAVGRMIHQACFLPIDRENDRAALKTILAAIDLIKRGEVSIGVFPEGTRHAGTELLPFRNGAFKIAQRAGCPVLIAALTGTDEVRRRFPWRATDVRLRFVDAIDGVRAAGMKTSEMGELARTCMTSALSAAS